MRRDSSRLAANGCALLATLLCAAACGPGVNPDKRGGVSVFLQPIQPPKGAALGAGFADETASGAKSCVSTVVGPCSVELACTGGDPKSAGTVSAAGSGGSIEIQYPYPNPHAMPFADFVWAPGSPITLAAGGGAVPAFSAVVTPPGAPTFAGTIGATTSRAMDLPLAWTLAAPIDRFQATLAANGGLAVCTFAAGDTSGSIPSAALSSLPAGPCEITLQAVDEQQPAAGDWTIKASAATQAIDQNGQTNLLLYTQLM
jgi:hypothetical protein